MYDNLTNVVTAFSTWAEFSDAMQNGYVPTIYPTSRRKRILIKIIRASGFSVWSGKVR